MEEDGKGTVNQERRQAGEHITRRRIFYRQKKEIHYEIDI